MEIYLICSGKFDDLEIISYETNADVAKKLCAYYNTNKKPYEESLYIIPVEKNDYNVSGIIPMVKVRCCAERFPKSPILNGWNFKIENTEILSGKQAKAPEVTEHINNQFYQNYSIVFWTHEFSEKGQISDAKFIFNKRKSEQGKQQ